MSEPRTTHLSDDPADYLAGSPTGGESSRTEGGTTRDGGVARHGSSRTGGGKPEDKGSDETSVPSSSPTPGAGQATPQSPDAR